MIMTRENELFYLMQMAGGTFPSGGFSQSWGLETYVAEGRVRDEEGFILFARAYLESSVACCEGPVMREAARLSENWDSMELKKLEELSRALKAVKESRESSLRMGKAFMRIMADITEDEKLEELKSEMGQEGITYPVAYGAICGRLGLDIQRAAEAFVFSTVNALTQSAVKLIPLGNKQAQGILLKLYPVMRETVEKSLQTPLKDISNFCPALDMAGMRHEYLTTRLYMS